LTLTPSRLAADLRRLGVREGGVLMVHTRMSALGWVVGAAEGVVRGLLEALGPEGTLMAYASWEDHVYMDSDRPEEHRAAYREEPPVFDLLVSEAARDHGRIPERVRTWPGAERSHHPEASVVAIGPRARWLCDPHPDNDAYGDESPFARLVEAGGQVLMLGAPLETITLLHHAEAMADVPDKRTITYRIRLASGEEREYTDIETSQGAFDYASLDLPAEDFEVIARAALDAGIGVRGRVGEGESHLFPAPELLRFGVAWMEERFG
jgi:aminoglycoside 3-N-acetyltransferase